MNMRGDRAPQVANPRRTRGGEENMSRGGDPGEWRTCPAKQRRCVVNNSCVELTLDHVEQGNLGSNMWQGSLIHTTQGETMVNDISRVIILQNAQKDNHSTFMGVYVIKDQMRMDKEWEIPSAQHTRVLDVINTFKLGFMEFDGMVHRDFPMRK